MIKYLIVEDESLSCQELKRMIARLRPGYKLEGWTENMAQTIGFLKNNRVDLIRSGYPFRLFSQQPARDIRCRLSPITGSII